MFARTPPIVARAIDFFFLRLAEAEIPRMARLRVLSMLSPSVRVQDGIRASLPGETKCLGILGARDQNIGMKTRIVTCNSQVYEHGEFIQGAGVPRRNLESNSTVLR